MERYYSIAPAPALDEKEIKIVKRGIASIVTYADKRLPRDDYSVKQRFIWPKFGDNGSKFISRKIVGRAAV